MGKMITSFYKTSIYFKIKHNCSLIREYPGGGGGACALFQHSGDRGRWISLTSRPIWFTKQVPVPATKLQRETLA